MLFSRGYVSYYCTRLLFFSTIIFSLLSCSRRYNDFIQLKPVPADAWLYSEAERILQGLSLSQKASQVLMTGIDGNEHFSGYLKEHYRDCVPGAILLFKYNIADTPDKVHSFLQTSSRTLSTLGSPVPVLFAIDHEGGFVYRTGELTTKLPSARDVASFASVDQARQLYYHSARQLRLLGITMNLSPVAEIHSHENSGFLDDRAFSDTPSIAFSYSVASVEAHFTAGAVSVVKHFPGIGSSDPHVSVPVINGSKDEVLNTLSQVFLPLFRHSAQAVLVSHAIVPSIDPGIPFCLSYTGVTDILRKKMGFSGLIITDDISMDAIRNLGYTSSRAAVAALEAGCDMIMTSDTDIRTISHAIQTWAQSDPVREQRLNAAVKTILFIKLKGGALRTSLGSYKRSSYSLSASPIFDSVKYNSEKTQGDSIVEILNEQRNRD